MVGNIDMVQKHGDFLQVAGQDTVHIGIGFMHLLEDGVQIVQRLDGGQVQIQRFRHVQIIEREAIVLGPFMHGGNHVGLAVQLQVVRDLGGSDRLHAGQILIHHFVGDLRNAAVLGELHHGIALRVEEVELFLSGQHDLIVLQIVAPALGDVLQVYVQAQRLQIFGRRFIHARLMIAGTANAVPGDGHRLVRRERDPAQTGQQQRQCQYQTDDFPRHVFYLLMFYIDTGSLSSPVSTER